MRGNIETMEIKYVIKAGIELSCAVEQATNRLEGLMPLIKTKVDSDLFMLIDETIQRNLMAVASFDSYMRDNFKITVDALADTNAENK